VSTQVNFVPLTAEEKEEEAQGTGILVDPTGMLIQLLAGGVLGGAGGAEGDDYEEDGEDDDDEEGEGEGEGEEGEMGDITEKITNKVSLLQLLQGAENDDDEGGMDYDPDQDPDQGEDEDYESGAEEDDGEGSDEEGAEASNQPEGAPGNKVCSAVVLLRLDLSSVDS